MVLPDGRRTYMAGMIAAGVAIVLAVHVYHPTDPAEYDYRQRCEAATGDPAYCADLAQKEVLSDYCHEANRPGTPLHCHWNETIDHDH